MAMGSQKIRHAIALVALSLVVTTVPVLANTISAQGEVRIEASDPGPVLVSALTGVFESSTSGGIRSVAQVPSSLETFEATVVASSVRGPSISSAGTMLISNGGGAVASSDQSALSVMTAQADLAMLQSAVSPKSQSLSQPAPISGKVMTIAQFN